MKAVVAVLALGVVLAAAKPPPAPGGAAPAAPAPWAAFVGKPGVMGRSLVGLGDNPAGGVGSPMSPFLKLKPFLPAKPTFMPPAVDPSAFIDMKASLLNSLFPGGLPAAAAAPVYGAAPAAYSGLSERALLSPFAAPAPAPAAAKPPPPAFLADLFKALNINKTVANATDATAPAPPAYPGPAFSPFAAPVVDPGVFISKKAKFLSDLFAGLAVTTPAPVEEPVAGDAVNAELAATLQRLLDSLAVPVPAVPQDAPEDEVSAVRAKRAADSAALVADAKDKVVDTIIGQLAELKNGMVDAVSDLALAQKAADAANAAAAAAAAPKKPVSPYAAMWAKPGAGAAATTVKPPPAVEPVRQKVVLLGQVFDMLTDMEKDIATSMAVPPTTDSSAAGVESPAVPASPDLMDMVRAKIGQMMANSTAVNKTTLAAPVFTTAPKTLRLVPGADAPGASASAPAAVDPTFWIPDSPLVGPGAYLAKTKEFLANLMAAKSTPSPIVRRSYGPSYYQQQQTEGSSSAPSQQQQPPQSGGQEHKFSQQANPGAAIAYQLQQLHHHHHNRQPYWWN